MSSDSHSCPSCGARVPAGASTCDLCGAVVEEDTEAPSSAGPDAEPEKASPPNAAAPAAEDSASRPDESEETAASVFCNQCGWENPTGANYCSQCGSELQDLSAAQPAAAQAENDTRRVTADLPSGGESSPEVATEVETGAGDEPAEMGQQIMLVVGVALALVLGLFFATQWSQDYEWNGGGSESGPTATQSTEEGGSAPSSSGPSPGGPSAGAPGGAGTMGGAASGQGTSPTDLQTLVDNLGGAVEDPVAGKIDSVRAVLDGASGERARQLRAQLVRLYIGAGTPGRAALAQSMLADQTGEVEDRRRMANLLYKWMRRVEQQGDRAKVADVARHVAEAYAEVVEQRPQDLDVRTRMGEAYLLTNNPMKGIRAINQVLEDDSTFVPARFQKGLALLQINRLDQAVRQFERVMRHASQDDPFYQQAKRAIEVIREQASSSNGEGANQSQSSS